MSNRRNSVTNAAFEIRFVDDSALEVVELTPDRISPERHIPDPFRKRDKIPRNSGSYSATTVAPEPSSTLGKDSPTNKNYGSSNSKIPTRKIYGTGRRSRTDPLPSQQRMSNASMDDSDTSSTATTDYKYNFLNGRISQQHRQQQNVKYKNKKRAFSGDESEQEIPKKYSKDNYNIDNAVMNERTISASPSFTADKNNYSNYSNRVDGLTTPPATPPRSITPTNNRTDSYATAEPSPRNSSMIIDQTVLSDNSSSYTVASETTAISTPPHSRRLPPISTSPTTLASATNDDDVELSPSDELPPPKKQIIPHDEVIIPTVAKRLKKKEQFNESQRYSTPNSPTEQGYTDVTDYVEDLFDSAKKYPTYPRRKTSTPTSTPTTRRGTRSRQNSAASKTRPIVNTNNNKSQTPPRVVTANARPQQIINNQNNEIEDNEGELSGNGNSAADTAVMNTSDTGAAEDPMRVGRRARREEWVMVMRDEEEGDVSGSYGDEKSEKSTSTTWNGQPSENEIDQSGGDTQASPAKADTINPKIVLTSDEHNARPLTLELQSTQTNSENHYNSSEATSTTPKRNGRDNSSSSGQKVTSFPLTPSGTRSVTSTPRKTEYGDRFIPLHIHDPAVEFQRLTPPITKSKRKYNAGDRTPETRSYRKDDDKDVLYRAVLENTMFPDNDLPDDSLNIQQTLSSTPRSQTLLKFRSPSNTPRSLMPIDSPNREVYSVSPISMGAQNILENTRQATRQVTERGLYKVLDAPNIRDDFYLNVLDWSSTNFIGVALDNEVFLYNVRSPSVTTLAQLKYPEYVSSVNWSIEGTHIAIGTNRGIVRIYDVCRMKMVRKSSNHNLRVGCLAWQKNILTTGSRDANIYHIDVRSPEPFIGCLNAHTQEICGLKWSQDEQLASGGNDNILHIWDQRKPSPLYSLRHKSAVKAIAWSPHARSLIASGGGSQDQRIRFWTTYTGRNIASYLTGSQVTNLAWSEQVNELASTHGYSRNEVVVWKYPSMDELVCLTGHKSRVLYLAAAPDGRSIVTGAGDEVLRFWNVFSQKKQKTSESTISLRNFVIR
ncbi:6393_t:CDS:10 [Ambispora gerdemannii]|uniref:6393_t:CDS:1 n=1 Tax=Ambispora gerdemannii TaxID=144530 RepID=A0A9N8WDQ5_9GLOM|nr:6393_t:CDS:10 [Ambispora gerdemannii]